MNGTNEVQVICLRKKKEPKTGKTTGKTTTASVVSGAEAASAASSRASIASSHLTDIDAPFQDLFAAWREEDVAALSTSSTSTSSTSTSSTSTSSKKRPRIDHHLDLLLDAEPGYWSESTYESSEYWSADDLPVPQGKRQRKADPPPLMAADVVVPSCRAVSIREALDITPCPSAIYSQHPFVPPLGPWDHGMRRFNDEIFGAGTNTPAMMVSHEASAWIAPVEQKPNVKDEVLAYSAAPTKHLVHATSSNMTTVSTTSTSSSSSSSSSSTSVAPAPGAASSAPARRLRAPPKKKQKASRPAAGATAARRGNANIKTEPEVQKPKPSNNQHEDSDGGGDDDDNGDNGDGDAKSEIARLEDEITPLPLEALPSAVEAFAGVSRGEADILLDMMEAYQASQLSDADAARLAATGFRSQRKHRKAVLFQEDVNLLLKSDSSELTRGPHGGSPGRELVAHACKLVVASYPDSLAQEDPGCIWSALVVRVCWLLSEAGYEAVVRRGDGKHSEITLFVGPYSISRSNLRKLIVERWTSDQTGRDSS